MHSTNLSSNRQSLLAEPSVTTAISTPSPLAEQFRFNSQSSLVFIDSSVTDYQTLVAGAVPGAEVQVLTPGDAIAQITQALAGRTGISSLHLVSHGQAGGLQLGKDWLSWENLRSYSGELQSWSQALTPEADILLYGCEVASGLQGEALVQQLAQFTGAEVAASNNLTGNGSIGGDWVLEVQTGSIESALAFQAEALAEYHHTLLYYGWAQQVGNSSGIDRGLSTAVDAAGNLYVTGTFTGTVDFDAGAGVANLTSAGNSDAFVMKLDAGGTLQWVRNLGGTANDSGNGIGVDSAGNVYITGSFNGTADFDPDSSTFNLTSAGNTDIFVTKLDESGTFVWASRMGGTNADQANAIQIDSADQIYLAGSFSGTVDFDPSATTRNLTSAGGTDAFVAKLNGAGDLVWANRMGGSSTDQATAIALDNAGNLYTTGSFSGTADFDPGAGVVNLVSAGGTDLFVSKLDTNGSFVWARQMGGTGTESAGGIAVDQSGAVYTIGSFSNTADFDPGAPVFNLASLGNTDAFLSKLDSAGNFSWAHRIGGTRGDLGTGVVVTASGKVYVTGTFRGTVDFDPGAGTLNLTGTDSSERPDIFFAQFNSNGSFAWAGQIAGNGNDRSYSLTLDGFGNLYSTGSFQGTADFDLGTGVANLSVPVNDETVYILKLGTNYAPVLDAAVDVILNPVSEDAGAPVGTVGTLISQWVDLASVTGGLDNVTDIDGIGLGIAITAADSTNGTWWYSLDNGGNWALLGTLSSTSARLLAADGNTRLYFQPNANYNGTLTNAITFRAWDQTIGVNGGLANATINGNATPLSGATDTASLVVTPVNDEPTAVDDTITTAEDTPVTITVLGNDGFAPDVNETLTIAGVGTASNGTVTLVNNALNYTPNANFFGTDSFTYTISDGNGGSSTATVTVTVTSVNNNPTALDDAVTIAEDSGTTPITVLGNDSFAPDVSETLTITGVGTATNGTVTLVNNALNYTPNANFFGTDSFTYTISDGNGGSSTATVTVTVTPTNDNPTAFDDAVTIAEDSGTTPINVLGNDSFAPDANETLTIAGVGTASNGTVTLVNNALNYTPNANFFGTDSFTYTISDSNGGSSTATVTVTVTSVNNNPTALDDAVTIAEDSGTTPITVLGNDSFAPDVSETLTITGVGTATHGTVTLVNNALNYTPNANFFGTDSFTYTISDGNGGSSTATVTVTVTPVNDVPTLKVPVALTVNEDTPFSFGGGTAIVLSDSDAGTGLMAVTVRTTNGALALGSSAGLTRVWGDSSAIGFEGTLASINDALANLQYQGKPHYSGTDTLRVEVNDQGNTGGNALANAQTIAVTINSVNDAPSFNRGADLTLAIGSGAQSIANWATNLSPGANETGQTLAFVVSTTSTSLFAVQPAIDSTGRLTFTPNPTASGIAIVNVQLRDNGGTANGGTDISPVQTFTINLGQDTTAPTASLGLVAPVTTLGNATQTFTVTYGDNLGINVASLDSRDIRVTGPNGFSQLATLVAVNNTSNGTVRTATYQVAAPSGSWGGGDNGIYTVSVEPSQVSDIAGNAVAAGVLGSFSVDINQNLGPINTNPRDFNGDGKTDIVWRDYKTGRNYIWLMDGTTLLGQVELPAVTNPAWQIEGSGDFNGDGHSDILWRCYDTTGPEAGKVYIWTMNGTTPTSTVMLPLAVTNPNWRIEGVGDFTGDGKVDILWRCYDTTGPEAGMVSIWEMKGTTATSTIVLPTRVMNPDWQIETVGDFTGDGKVDILWRCYGSSDDAGKIAIWAMNGTQPLSTQVLPAVVRDNRWQIEMAGDFNGDGSLDIVWRNYSTGENRVWLMNRTQLVDQAVLAPVQNLDWNIEDRDFLNNSSPWRGAVSGLK